MTMNGLRSPHHRKFWTSLRLIASICLLSHMLLGSLTMAQNPAQAVAGQQPAAAQNPDPKAQQAKAAPTGLSYVAEAEKSGKGMRVALKDAIKMALQNNLTIAIQEYESENYEQRMIGDRGAYDPNMTFSLATTSRTNPNTSPFNQSIGGSGNLTNKSLQWSFGLSQVLPTGANYSMSYSTNRATSNSNSTYFTPSYGLNMTMNFTQPLLRNFRINSTKRQIRITKLDANSNDITFEDSVTAVIKSVQDAYWDLVFAIRNHEILRNSLELAKVQLDNNRRKVEIGTLAPIEITSAEATVSQRDQSLIAGLERIHVLENNLKRLLSRSSQADIWDKILVPTDEPTYTKVDIQLGEAIQSAIENRPELRKMRNELTKMDVNESFYRNQKRPSVDFVASFGSTGTAGGLSPAGQSCTIGRNPDGSAILGPCVSADFIGGMGTAAGQVLGMDFTNWSVGAQVTIPLRNRSNESQLAQQLIAKRKYQKQLSDQEQAIQVEVRNAYQAIETNRQRVNTAEKGVQLAKEQLDGENKRFEAGLSTTFLVLDRQDRYQQAEGTYLQALVDYRKTTAALYKAMFKTITQNDIEVAKAQPDSDK